MHTDEMAKRRKKTGGMALALVVGVMAVLVILSLSLLAVAARVNAGAQAAAARSQCRITVSSFCDVLEDALTTEHEAGRQLRETIRQSITDGWDWYDEEVPGHEDLASVTRSYDLEGYSDDNGYGSVTAAFYWTLDAADREADPALYQYTGSTLTVTVTCQYRGQTQTADCRFVLDAAGGEWIWKGDVS
jgi:hypothetical protein